MAELRIVHSSDLHLVDRSRGDPLLSLRRVLRATVAAGADALLLAGDVFDSNRLSPAFVEEAIGLIAALPAPVVVLPGNHDCLIPGSAWLSPAAAAAGNLVVLGRTVDEVAGFPELGLEIWGRAHRDHVDMSPLRNPAPRCAPRRIDAGHGHWVRDDHDRHHSWLIHEEEIAATDADYVALGHWDVPQRVGNGRVPAYYSGSPAMAGTVNLVSFAEAGVQVARLPLAAD